MSDGLPEIVEMTSIATDSIDGLHHVYLDRNGNARLVFYREQRDDDGDGKIRRVVTARMVIPYRAMLEAAGLMVAAVKIPPTEQDPSGGSRLRALN